MVDSQFEVNLSAFDAPCDQRNCSNLYDNSYNSWLSACRQPLDSNANTFLPGLSVGDVNSMLYQSEQVLDSAGALFSPQYAEQMKTIDGYDAPGSMWNGHDGQITQMSVEQWLNEARDYPDSNTFMTDEGTFDAPSDKASRYPDELVAKLTQLDQMWNSDAGKELQNDGGSISQNSFNLGRGTLESLVGTLDMKADGKAVDNAATNDAAAPLDTSETSNDLYNAIASASTVQTGEGPYQSAQRLLSLDGGPVDHTDALALAHAMGDQYTCDQQAQGAGGDLRGLRANTQLLTAENAGEILSRISNEDVRQRLAKILGVG